MPNINKKISSKNLIYKNYLDNIDKANTIRLGVGLLLYFEDNLLLEQRSDCEKWGLIGGGVEIGEIVEDTAIRECFEETSLKIKKENLELIGLYSDIKQHRVIQYDDNCFHAIDIIYSYQLFEKDLTLKKSRESLDISFFSIKNLPKDLVPPAKNPIEDFIKRKFKL